MLKKNGNNTLFMLYLVISIFTLITLTGCVIQNVGIVKPNIPMSKQCVITGYNYNGSGGGYFSSIWYDNIDLKKDSWASVEYGILPAGNIELRITRKYVRDVDYYSTGNTKHWTRLEYYEQWHGTFNFEPGKYYFIKVTGTDVTWEGRTIKINDSNVNYNQHTYTISHPSNTNIEIIEDPNKAMGSIYIKPFFGITLGQKYWDYIPGASIFNIGPTFGIRLIKGWLNMDIGIEAFPGISISYPFPDEKEAGFSFTYDYGAFTNFNLGRIVLGGGIGMGNGNVWYNKITNSDGENTTEEFTSIFYTSVPYAEAYLGLSPKLFRRSMPAFGIYGRYYFTDVEDGLSNIGVGLKARL
jgi:hypothetical protein